MAFQIRPVFYMVFGFHCPAPSGGGFDCFENFVFHGVKKRLTYTSRGFLVYNKKK